MFLSLTWFIFLIPLIALPIITLLEYLKTNAGAIVACGATSISSIISIGSFIEILSRKTAFSSHMPWIETVGGDITISFGVYLDTLSALMSVIVSVIGTLILIYSIEYMSHEKKKSKHSLPRYYLEMTFFIGSMLGLVLSYDLIQMYIFWEGVGLASFLLIGYWWDKPAAKRGAKEAFILTRVGDVFFMGAIVYILFTPKIQSFAIESIFTLGGSLATLLSLCLFIAAIGKSAQIPLFPWLAEKPSAMQGPTTVSALIHAATMVKAGVFLVARFYPLFHAASFPVLRVVAYVGGITSVFAGIVATWKTDIKRVLGYSTISHLGFMFLALGAGAYTAGLFHLLSHSIFKALLFLTSGCVLHATEEMRNMTKLGGLWNKMKTTRWLGLIGAISISGLPPFNGFWSKEAVLSGINEFGDPLLFFLGIVAAMTSAFYIWRWIFMIFGGKARSKEAEEAHEVAPLMTGPVAILAIGAIISGLLIEFIGLHTVLPEAKIAEAIMHHSRILSEGLLIGLSLGLTLLGTLVTYEIYQKGAISPEVFTKNKLLGGFHRVFKNAWYFEGAYNFLGEKVVYEGISKGLDWFDNNIIDGVVRGVAMISRWISSAVIWSDIHIIDGIVRGFARASTYLGGKLRRVQSGIVEHYVTSLLIGLSVATLGFILWMLFPGVFLSIIFF